MMLWQIFMSYNACFLKLISAGYIASIMGLPIKLVAAVNQNGATHRILSEGVFKEPDEVLKSISCSMDIAVSFNWYKSAAN